MSAIVKIDMQKTAICRSSPWWAVKRGLFAEIVCVGSIAAVSSISIKTLGRTIVCSGLVFSTVDSLALVISLCTGDESTSVFQFLLWSLLWLYWNSLLRWRLVQ